MNGSKKTGPPDLSNKKNKIIVNEKLIPKVIVMLCLTKSSGVTSSLAILSFFLSSGFLATSAAARVIF